MTTGMTTELRPTPAQLMARVGDKKMSTSQRISSVGDLLKACEKQLVAALPKHMSADRLTRVVLNCLRNNPSLLECSAASLYGAVIEAATYGWELGGVMGHAYLVPYGEECKLVPGYKGLIDLCRRSGTISTITMEVVHEGDTFSYSMGDSPHVTHQPNDRDLQRDAKPVTHAYAVVGLRDGGIQRSVWSQERINAHRDQYSEAWKRGEKYRLECEQKNWTINPKKLSFWHTAPKVAAKKTVVRDMIARGLIPMSAEYREVADRVERVEAESIDLTGIFGVDDLPQPKIESAPQIVHTTPEQDGDPTVMSAVDKFRAECLECELTGAVDLVVEKWLGEGSARELSTDDAADMRLVAKERQQQIRDARGKK